MWYNFVGFGMVSLRLKIMNVDQLMESLQVIEDIWVNIYFWYVFEY